MAAIFGRTERNIELSGQTCQVPAGDEPALSYYLCCINSLMVSYDISADVINWRSARYLGAAKRDALIGIAYLFSPEELINKLIIVDDDHGLLPRGSSNKFLNLSDVTQVIAIASDTVVGGQQTQVTKVMLCTTEWLERYWIAPMKNLKYQLANVASKSVRDIEAYLGAVELQLQLHRLSDLVGKLEVSPSTNHCSHCKGGKALCACDQGCARKSSSECVDHPTTRCDSCMTLGLVGNRYKCRDCHDFDLCSRCYTEEKGGHLRCGFTRISKEGKSPVLLAPRVQLDHPNVTCDGCKRRGFDGNRYKCRECHDFDLCSRCYLDERGGHLRCGFSRISKEGQSPVVLAPRVQLDHPTVTCGQCKKRGFDGPRYKCREGHAYDLCQSCYRSENDSHLRCRFWRINTEGAPTIDEEPRHEKPPPPTAPSYDEMPFAQAFPVDNISPSAPYSYSSASAVPVSAVPVSGFTQGQTVRVKDLPSNKCNGCCGVIEKEIPGGKYVVNIPSEGKTIFQAKNLEGVIESDPKYPVDACVELKGLATKHENGKYGLIVGQAEGKITVRLLDENRVLKVRKENLILIDEAG